MPGPTISPHEETGDHRLVVAFPRDLSELEQADLHELLQAWYERKDAELKTTLRAHPCHDHAAEALACHDCGKSLIRNDGYNGGLICPSLHRMPVVSCHPDCPVECGNR